MSSAVFKSASVFRLIYGTDDHWTLLPTEVKPQYLPLGQHQARGVFDLTTSGIDLSGGPVTVTLNIQPTENVAAILWFNNGQFWFSDSEGNITVTFTSAMLTTGGTLPGRFLLEVVGDVPGDFTWTWSSLPGACTLSAVAQDGQVVLAWTPASGQGPISYVISLETTGGALISNSGFISPANSLNPVYTWTGLVDGYTYNFQVRAHNSNGYGPYSNMVPATPTAVGAPPGPPQINAIAGYNTQIILGWLPPSGVVAWDPSVTYKVFRSLVAGGPYSLVVSGLAQSPYTDTGLTNGTRYYYVMKAHNVYGDSLATAEVSAIPHATNPPPAPSWCAAFWQQDPASGIWEIVVQWDDSLNGTTGSYDVYFSTDNVTFSVIDNTILATDVVAETGALARSNDLYFYVIAKNTNGNSSPSPTYPVAVYMGPTVSSVSQDTSVLLSWTNPSSAFPPTSFNVKIASTPQGPFDLVAAEVPYGVASFAVNNLVNGSTYYFIVTNNTNNGYVTVESLDSNLVSETPEPLVGPPLNLRAKAVAGPAIQLDWDAAVVYGGTAPVKWYLIYRSTTGAIGSFVFIGVQPSGLTITDSPLSANTQYWYYLQAEDQASHISAASNIVTATTGSTAPVITSNPTNLTVNDGASATFTIVATGVGLTYQWRKNTVPIGAANSASYHIATAHSSDVGTYDCVVSNSGGSVISTGATLTVVVSPPAPVITTQPSSTSVQENSSVTFTVVATGSNTLHYQWRFNGAVIIGAADSATYRIANTRKSDQGSYSVTVSNNQGPAPGGGSTTSRAAVLTVQALFDFTTVEIFRFVGGATISPPYPTVPVVSALPDSRVSAVQIIDSSVSSLVKNFIVQFFWFGPAWRLQIDMNAGWNVPPSGLSEADLSVGWGYSGVPEFPIQNFLLDTGTHFNSVQSFVVLFPAVSVATVGYISWLWRIAETAQTLSWLTRCTFLDHPIISS